VRHNVYKTTLDLKLAHDPLQRQHRRGQLPQGRKLDMRELLGVMADDKMYRDKELRRSPGAEANA
jgi:hypothetical protein